MQFNLFNRAVLISLKTAQLNIFKLQGWILNRLNKELEFLW